MSAFDATVRIGGAAVVLPEGQTVEAFLITQPILLVPIDQHQAMPLPIGQIKNPIGKEQAEALLAQLQEIVPQMTSQSRIEVASTLAGADRAEQITRNLKG